MENARTRRVAEWKKKIQQWETSGMSACSWCRERDISYNSFLYWKEKLKGSVKLQREFHELPPPEGGGVKFSLEFKGICLTIDRNFDETCLIRVIRALEKV